MNQNDAPIGTVGILGHPANEILIVKYSDEFWRYVHNGKLVDPDDFRAGWDVYTPPEPEPLDAFYCSKIPGTGKFSDWTHAGKHIPGGEWERNKRLSIRVPVKFYYTDLPDPQTYED